MNARPLRSSSNIMGPAFIHHDATPLGLAVYWFNADISDSQAMAGISTEAWRIKARLSLAPCQYDSYFPPVDKPLRGTNTGRGVPTHSVDLWTHDPVVTSRTTAVYRRGDQDSWAILPCLINQTGSRLLF